MSSWKFTTLGTVCTFSQGIQVDINKQYSEPGIGLVRFIRIVDFTKDNPSDIRYVNHPGDKYLVDESDLVMIRYGSRTAGKIARGFKGVIANNTFKISPKSNSAIDKNFMYHLLSQKSVYEHFTLLNASSTMPAITFSMASSLEISLPPLPEQEAIAEILSSLDDKIDLLHRNNKTLEQLAETLFRQWLGSSQAEKIGRLAELVVVHDNKRIPLSSREREKRKEGTLYPYYGAASIMDYINDYIFDGDYLLLGEDGTVQTEDGFPIIQRAMGKFWVNNHTHVLTAKSPATVNFLEILLKFTSVSHIVTGAVQPKINQGNLMDLEVPIPDSAYMATFSLTVDPLLEKRNKNNIQIKVLSTLRDSLLPKLMSGEVRVKMN